MFIIDKLLQDLTTKYNKSIQWVHYKIKEYLAIAKKNLNLKNSKFNL